MIASKDSRASPDENAQPRATVPTKGGKAVHITTKSFDLRSVKEALRQVKTGSGSALRIEILQESSTLDQSLQPLGIVG
jgi:hypothetical protein